MKHLLPQANDVERLLWQMHYKTIEQLRDRITKLSRAPPDDAASERSLSKVRALKLPVLATPLRAA